MLGFWFLIVYKYRFWSHGITCKVILGNRYCFELSKKKSAGHKKLWAKDKRLIELQRLTGRLLRCGLS